MTDFLERRGKFEHEDTQGEWHVMMEAAIGVMHLQAKEHRGLLATTRS